MISILEIPTKNWITAASENRKLSNKTVMDEIPTVVSKENYFKNQYTSEEPHICGIFA